MAEDADLIERQPPRRSQIGGDARAGGDPVVQRHDALVASGLARKGAGKRIIEPRHDLVERQIGIARARADQITVAARIMRQHFLEIAEKFGQPVLAEILGAAQRCGLLVLVIKARRDRVMSIVNLGDEIGHGELELMGPKLAGRGSGRQTEPASEIKEDVRGLPDEQIAGLEEGGRKGRMRDALAIEEAHHLRHAARPPGHVEVIGAALLQREPHEFAATRRRGPIVKLITHGLSSSRTRL